MTQAPIQQWNELDRILQLKADTGGSANAATPPPFWMDAWCLYENMCLVCTGVCAGRPWCNSQHGLQESWTGSEEDRFLDNPVHVHTHGEGIEGRLIAVAAAGSSFYGTTLYILL